MGAGRGVGARGGAGGWRVCRVEGVRGEGIGAGTGTGEGIVQRNPDRRISSLLLSQRTSQPASQREKRK